MKIKEIALTNVLIPLAPSDLPRPVGRNYGAFLLVRVRCDDGLEGVGEGYSGNATSAVTAAIRDMLAPEIIGQEATNITGLYERMYRCGFYFGRVGILSVAISAVEMALWDILGKHLGAPVHALLGGWAKRSVAPFASLRPLADQEEEKKVLAYASLQTFRTPEEVGIVAKEAVKAGYRSVKLHQVDIASIKAAREAVGDEIEITIDVNGFFNSLEAERFAKKLADYNAGWLEDPIWPPDDYRTLAWLRRRSPVPIAGGENESTVWGFERILEAEAVDLLQPEVLIAGGILESFKVIAMAHGRSIPVGPHNFRYGPVLAASLHLSLASPNVTIQETPWFELEANILREGPTISNGFAMPSDLPGLGVVVDEDVVKQYQVDQFPRK